MSEHAGDMRDKVEAVYRSESRHVLATLIRLLGDFDVAEEALHDAFASALEQWPRDGMPANPRAWLVSAGHLRQRGVKPRAAADGVDAFEACGSFSRAAIPRCPLTHAWR